MKDAYIGFDTSNYTTSCAVCDEDGKVVANLKIPLPVEHGGRGLRQSEALFHHTKNMPRIMEGLSAVLADYLPLAVGVSVAPRDADGSYMPCFLAGVSAANAFAACRCLCVHEFSHQNGHIMAALYSAERQDLLTSERFVAFHVSGGTTEALLVTPNDKGFSVELLGYSSDINAGQAIDRVGVSLGLDFPCGARLEELAAAYSGRIDRHSVCVRDGVCSLSGAENLAAKIYKETEDKGAVAAFVFDFICRTLTAMCEDIIKKYGNLPVIFAGGVMSNHLMRKNLSEKFDAYFADGAFSADNAAGIALLCRQEVINEKRFKCN